MTRLRPTTREDLPKIEEWIEEDPFHKDDSRCTPEGLLTGNGVLTFCVQDDQGPLCFVRLDDEEGILRLSTQFGPESEVSKQRLVVGLLTAGIPAIIEFGKSNHYGGIIFESVNESLIKFMEKQNFVLDKGDDYLLRFNLENSE
jgi:hypothetical protein